MENMGATWEHIVALAKCLDHEGGKNARPEDQILLATYVLDFHRNIVSRPLKRALPDRPSEVTSTRAEVSPPVSDMHRRSEGVAA